MNIYKKQYAVQEYATTRSPGYPVSFGPPFQSIADLVQPHVRVKGVSLIVSSYAQFQIHRKAKKVFILHSGAVCVLYQCHMFRIFVQDKRTSSYCCVCELENIQFACTFGDSGCFLMSTNHDDKLHCYTLIPKTESHYDYECAHVFDFRADYWMLIEDIQEHDRMIVFEDRWYRTIYLLKERVVRTRSESRTGSWQCVCVRLPPMRNAYVNIDAGHVTCDQSKLLLDTSNERLILFSTVRDSSADRESSGREWICRYVFDISDARIDAVSKGRAYVDETSCIIAIYVHLAPLSTCYSTFPEELSLRSGTLCPRTGDMVFGLSGLDHVGDLFRIQADGCSTLHLSLPNPSPDMSAYKNMEFGRRNKCISVSICANGSIQLVYSLFTIISHDGGVSWRFAFHSTGDTRTLTLLNDWSFNETRNRAVCAMRSAKRGDIIQMLH